MANSNVFFTNTNKLRFDAHGIALLGEYKAWGRHKEAGGDGSNWPTHSANILNLKNGKDHVIPYFVGLLDDLIAPSTTIVVVPSHDPASTTSGLRKLAQTLASTRARIDATHCIVRHKKIQKLASGGDRSLQVHLDSLRLDDTAKIIWENVLVIDDVTTSGNSLLACQQILNGAIAANVQCLALGQTN